ncbi:asparagine synthase (glutamine-hydrolyzing) [Candidatus Gracilibacteria bacterium 28_42_T64]|nr:asparagine synthase (glutamine-hydrolyzing) [Candidatus Gracilibacteria bacterium 28_42_T64]
MCGITGIIYKKNSKISILERDEALSNQVSEIVHRGPDDRGHFIDADLGVYLGQTRLSIQDISQAGHQPMISSDQNTIIIYNGEVFNFLDLRKELEKDFKFQSGSDTEVILNGYIKYGEKFFEKLNGMFAIVIYDKINNKVVISRDTVGIKPFYYINNKDFFAFSSEINGLKIYTDGYNKKGITKVFTQGYTYGLDTIYDGIYKLKQGNCLNIPIPYDGAFSENTILSPQNPVLENDKQKLFLEFDKILKEAVNKVSISDVPISLFLSGGLDSSLLAYYLKESGVDFKAFTLGFKEDQFDESKIAKKISNFLGIDHQTFYINKKEVLENLDQILAIYNEPHVDFSSIPTYLLSKKVRKSGYKVALGGDGGDELFGGYPTQYLPNFLKYYSYVPLFLRRIFSKGVHLFPSSFGKLSFDEKLKRVLNGGMYEYKRAHFEWKRIFRDDQMKDLFTQEFYDMHLTGMKNTYFNDYFDNSTKDTDTQISQVIDVDFHTFLVDDCLVKSDRCSMKNGLEIRVPFLQNEIIEFAKKVPISYKIKGFNTKIFLREFADFILPKEITGLKKMGFTPPLNLWLLEDDFKKYFNNLLSEKNIIKTGIFNYNYVNQLLEDHFSKRIDRTKEIWLISSFVILNLN